MGLARNHVDALRSCVFLRTTVVVSELLTNLPNLNELATVFCVNVFKESQLSGVRRWFVLAEEHGGVLHESTPLLADATTNNSHDTKYNLTEHSRNMLGVSDQSYGADSSHQLSGVIETRTIAAVPLAVWSREKITQEDASRFNKVLPDSEEHDLKLSHNGSEFIDAVDFYRDVEVRARGYGFISDVVISIIWCQVIMLRKSIEIELLEAETF